MRGVCRLGVASLRRMSRWRGDGRRMLKWSGDGRRMEAGGPLARWPGGARAPSDRLRVSARARIAMPTPGAGRGAPGELAGEFSVWALGALEVRFAALFGL